MANNPFAAYHVTGTTTADPVTLTTMLYDGTLKALRKSRMHLEAGNRQGFHDETNRAYLIIGELRSTLDLGQGELAEGLAAIYAYCLRLLVEASMGDAAKIVEVEGHIGRIADAWRAATAQLKATHASGRTGAEAAA